MLELVPFAHSRVGDSSIPMQAKVDLEQSECSSDSQNSLSRAAVLQAQADSLVVPTDVFGDDEPIVRVKPKVTSTYEAYPPSISAYDQQSLSCGFFTQYERYIGHANDVYKVSDSLPAQPATRGRKPCMKLLLIHVIEQIKTSPAILECQTLLILVAI